MIAATLKEAMTHHAMAKHKKEDRQKDSEEELSNSERGWLWFGGAGYVW